MLLQNILSFFLDALLLCCLNQISSIDIVFSRHCSKRLKTKVENIYYQILENNFRARENCKVHAKWFCITKWHYDNKPSRFIQKYMAIIMVNMKQYMTRPSRSSAYARRSHSISALFILLTSKVEDLTSCGGTKLFMSVSILIWGLYSVPLASQF